ncbi:hypothetical protein QYE76_071791 [Lolium multiflorum]|uniref:Transposase (putative) gypsy type domain-containing protein n=1 Tax=Lolium multiflorum TaxID=4521 RepID=A0AAD8WEX1_LOLMU|nr:hypothetical protein QYE76_071791 [Lolium multiflorum]
MPRGGYRGGHCLTSSPSRFRSSRALLRARASCCSGERFSLANSGERISADPPPLLRRAGATGPRVSTERPPPPPLPPSRGSSSPFRLSWDSSSSSSSMASASGSWRGSYIRDDDIERLVRLRWIPSTVVARAPGAETEPKPEPGERVVFGVHLDRGLGLPASNFFRQFLDNFGLQPHHLPANACVLLSCYVAFMEAYAGLWPDIDFWRRSSTSRRTTDGRRGPAAPPRSTLGRMSFFYVRNEGGLVDRINLPEFNPAPPVGRINWSYNARTTDPDAEVNQLWDFLGAAVENGLTAEDLLCTIAERRVLPLQMRTHKIGHMSGRFDPTRTSRAPLSKAQVARRVNNITKANMPEEWNYGLAPRSRDLPPELQEDEEPATSATGPIPAVPLRARPPSATATSAPKGKKRVGDPRSTAALEAKAKKLRRQQPKKVPEAGLLRAAAPGKPRVSCRRFRDKGGSRRHSLHRTRLRRRPRHSAQGRLLLPCRWPQRLAAARGPSRRASRRWTTCSRAALAFDQGTGPAGACRLRPEPEPAGLRRRDRPEPGRAWWCWWRARRGASALETAAGRQSSRSAATAEPTREGPAGRAGKDEPAHGGRRLARAVRTEAPSAPMGSRMWPGRPAAARVVRPTPASGSGRTMEQAWLSATPTRAAETAANVAKVEEASKAVAERRTGLYNRAVTHYHKAKLDRADLARELEAVKAEAAKVPRLEADLRAARAQCAESEEAGRSAAAKLKVAELELARLRRLEKNHLNELASLRTAEKEKVEDLSRRLTEVEKQRLALQEEVTTKTTELSATAKRWVDEIGALDRDLSGRDISGRWHCARRTGEGSSEYFTMEDYMASMAARVEPITKLGWELRKAAEELVPMLWPAEAVPQDISNLISSTGRSRPRALEPTWRCPLSSPGTTRWTLGSSSTSEPTWRASSRPNTRLPACPSQRHRDFVDKSLFVADPNPPRRRG